VSEDEPAPTPDPGSAARHGFADPPAPWERPRPREHTEPVPTANAQHVPWEMNDDTTVLPAVVEEYTPLGGEPVVALTVPGLAVAAPPPARVGEHPPAASGEPGPAAASPQSRLQAKKSRRARRTARLGKAAVALVALLVFGVTGTAWSALRYVDSQMRTVQALDQGSPAIQQADQQLGDQNFLLVGSDSRAGASGAVGAGTVGQVSGARSDTTIVVHIPADRSRIVLVSFPRDVQVDLPECNRWNNDTATYSAEVIPPQPGVKLNDAYFEGGPRCITKLVQQLSGLNINHFIGVDFAGFQSMVDALGGVAVCTEQPLEDTVLGTVLPTAGTQTINGQQALNYVRARHIVGDPTSDYGRIQRQQRFLGSLLRAALSQNTLLNVGKLKRLVDAVTSSTFGQNVGVNQLITIAQSLQGLEASRVTFITAPTTGTANAFGNEVLLDSENSALFRAIREGSPLPGEAAAPTTTPPAPTTSTAPSAGSALAPAAVPFIVRNATTTPVLAAQTATSLAKYGFTAASTDNLGVNMATTVVRYPAGQLAAAQTLASAVPGATVELTPALSSGLELVLGSNFDGTTTAPAAVGSPLPAAGSAVPSGAPTPLPTNLTVVNGGDASCR